MFQNKYRPKGFNFPNRYYNPEKDEQKKRMRFSRLSTRPKHNSFLRNLTILVAVLWFLWYLSSRVS